MLNKNAEHGLVREVKNNLIKSMQKEAEKLLNPSNHHLSQESKKRLRWPSILYCKYKNNGYYGGEQEQYL